MLSVGTIHFENRFCASKKGGIGGGGWVSARGAMHMAAALAGYRIALVGTGLVISHLVSTIEAQEPLLSPPCKDTIFGFVGSFQSGGVFAGQRALTIESSLMTGCG